MQFHAPHTPSNAAAKMLASCVLSVCHAVALPSKQSRRQNARKKASKRCKSVAQARLALRWPSFCFSSALSSMRRSSRSCQRLTTTPRLDTLTAVRASRRMDDACSVDADLLFLLCETPQANRLKILGGKEPGQSGPSRAAWGRSRLVGRDGDWLCPAHGPRGLACGHRGDLVADGLLRVVDGVLLGAGGGCLSLAGSCLQPSLPGINARQATSER